MKKLFLLTTIFLLSAEVSFAAAKTFKELAYSAVDLLNLATTALFSLALAFFFWKVASSLFNYDADSSEKKKELKDSMLWGVIIIFVMVSIWGIIRILQSTLFGGL
ncbi:hypothetical protein COB52_02220 [Candidatus Kaiserbacteria bacterium]|nr:MAG: hypothetical protein COB52_02220 [Candidatus Kaiserbacteria bacterium]